MKPLLLILLLCISAGAFAQDVRVTHGVPAAVEKNFKKKFPTAKGVEWARKGDRMEADFDVSRVDHKALYDQKGRLLAWKCDLRVGQLPAPVLKTIRSQYKGYKVDDAEKITRDKMELYQVELDGNPDVSLVFDKDGKVVEDADWW